MEVENLRVRVLEALDNSEHEPALLSLLSQNKVVANVKGMHRVEIEA